MSSYCLKRTKNTESINPKVSKTKNEKQWYYQNVQYMGVKNQDLLKKKEASEMLSNLGLKTPLNEIPSLGHILFWTQFYWTQFHWM